MNYNFLGETVKREVDNLWDVYQESVFAKADHIFETVVRPFCQKRNYKFLSGSGDWFIYAGSELLSSVVIELDHADDDELQEIRNLLNIPIQGMPSDSLGTLMDNYYPNLGTESTFKKTLDVLKESEEK